MLWRGEDGVMLPALPCLHPLPAVPEEVQHLLGLEQASEQSAAFPQPH